MPGHRPPTARAAHPEPYEDLVQTTLERAGKGSCPNCGHEAIPELIRIMGRAAAGDFSVKPELPLDDHPISMLTVGLRFLLEDLETARARPHPERPVAPADPGQSFLNVAAEGLAAPITPILLQISLLRFRLADRDATVSASLRVLERNAHLLERRIRTILDLAMANQVHGPSSETRIALDQLVTDAIETLNTQDRIPKTRLTLDTAPTLIRGDPRLLQQLIWHLLTHTLDTAPAANPLHVQVRPEDGRCHLIITNRPATQWDRVEPSMRPVGRFDPPTQAAFGLAITLAAEIVHFHDGHMDAAYDEAGSHFHITLPCTTTQPQNTRPSDSKTGNTPSTSTER